MTTYAENPPFHSWRIRIKMSGLNIYVVSRTEPEMTKDEDGNPVVLFTAVPGYGDEVGYMDWSEVQAISWRYYADEFDTSYEQHLAAVAFMKEV